MNVKQNDNEESVNYDAGFDETKWHMGSGGEEVGFISIKIGFSENHPVGGVGHDEIRVVEVVPLIL